MMQASRRQSASGLPEKVSQPRNNKQKLRNDCIAFLTERELFLLGGEISGSGEALIKAMVDTFWHIDGQHDAFRERNLTIPTCFRGFSGYNVPERAKHRKRERSNLSSQQLQVCADALFGCLQGVYWERTGWSELRTDVEVLATTLSKYVEYLQSRCEAMKRAHMSPLPVRQISENIVFSYLPTSTVVDSCHLELDNRLSELDMHEHLLVEDVFQADPRHKYEYINKLKVRGLPCKVAMLSYSHGNNIGNLHFLWKCLNSPEEDISLSQQTIEKVKEKIPVYHTRSMRQALQSKFGRVTAGIKPCVLRALYRDLTNDHSSPSNVTEAEIDERMRMLLEMEDPDVVVDLRHLNSGQKSKYDVFWSECQKFLQEDVGSAVDDRRHHCVTHMAKAISVGDLREQVKARLPAETPVPSESWIRLQFWPKNRHAHSRIHYSGKLNIRFMVQARQFRKTHPDTHYAAALFKYQRECAVLFRDDCAFLCLDDKHRVKVGEPGFPVAAAERGRRVLVAHDSTFEVGDHDFTRMSIVPSVSFILDVPETIDDSWYSGKVLVGLKDATFEPSSPERHMAELHSSLVLQGLDIKPVLFLYTDGGPDHRLTYLSVQMSLISLFLKLDLDFLCVCRTAPFHSWKNPVERIMSILNLGFQCVGLMRKRMSDEQEAAVLKCNNMKQLRKAAETDHELASAVLDSMSPVKILLSDIISRLKLKGNSLETFPSASNSGIKDMWETLHSIDTTLRFEDKHQKSSLPSHPLFQEFLSHCCQARHYSFCVKKCGSTDCNICLPPRLPSDVFSKIHNLPDPTPGSDGHYKRFSEVYGTKTIEAHRPSLAKKAGKAKTLPFIASVQHVRNISLMIQCEECEMWRLLYSPKKGLVLHIRHHEI